MKVKMLSLKLNLLLFCILNLSCFVINAQPKDTSYIKYYPFMNNLPKDYLYYENGYLESKKTIEDNSIIWSEKEYPYWRFFISNIALLAPDSVVKQIWQEAFENSPHAICDFYSWIFNKPFDSKYLHQSPVAYFYLHNEKTFYDSVCNIIYSKYDSTLIKKMRIIVTDDNGRGNREVTNVQISKDSVNQIKVAAIIKSLGKYPGRSVVGTSLEEVAWLVIQHASEEFQKKYYAFVESAVLSKDLNPKYLAYTIDRINMGNNVPQIYGTQFTKVDNVNKLYPVRDLQNVDNLRKTLGLGPLKTYLEQNKILVN